MRRFAPAALLFACACASAPAEPPHRAAGRRHHVVVTSDAGVLDFVDAHGAETIDTLALNEARNTNPDRTPIDLAPLARMKSVHTLSLSGFTVWTTSGGLNSRVAVSPGLTDRQVADIARIRTLRRLDVRSCALTDDQRKLLKSQLPQCELREN